MRIDTTAASDPAVIGAIVPAPAVCSEMEPAETANPYNLDLHAFTHCPTCRGIIHRKSGCPDCEPSRRVSEIGL